MKKMIKVAVLDDYLGVVREVADWDALPENVDVHFFFDHLSDENVIAERFANEVALFGLGYSLLEASGPRRDASLFTLLGRHAEDAMSEVRRRRPGSVESRAQEQAVRDYETHLRG